MLSNIVKYAVISLIIIAFTHYFYNYFKTNFTTPRVINLNNDLNISKENSVQFPVNLDIKNIKFEKTEQIVPEEPPSLPNMVKQMPTQSVSESAVMTNELSAFLNNELKKELKLKSL